MDTWIKLHRKALDNKMFRTDITAWHIFTALLLLADHKSGAYMTGRFQLSNITGIKPDTVYKALKRLQKNGMIELLSNNKFTQVRICNWVEYQSTGHNKVTTKSQQSNTKQEVKNEEVKKLYISPTAQSVLDCYNTIFKKQLQSSVAFEENLAFWLMHHSLAEIETAFKNAKLHPFWKDKMTPTLMFRRKNPRGEPVDYISDLVAYRPSPSEMPRPPEAKVIPKESVEQFESLWKEEHVS